MFVDGSVFVSSCFGLVASGSTDLPLLSLVRLLKAAVNFDASVVKATRHVFPTIQVECEKDD